MRSRFLPRLDRRHALLRHRERRDDARTDAGLVLRPVACRRACRRAGSYTIGWLVYAAFAALSVPLATSRQATVQPWVCGGEVEEVSATVSNAPQPDETAAPRE